MSCFPSAGKPNQPNAGHKPNTGAGGNAPKSDHNQSTPANPNNTRNVGAKK